MAGVLMLSFGVMMVLGLPSVRFQVLSVLPTRRLRS